MALRVMVINPSGEESLGVLQEPLSEANAKVDELVTKEVAERIEDGEAAPQVRVVESLPRASAGYDCLIMLGSPSGVLTSPPADANDVQVPPQTIEQVERLVRDFHMAEKPVLGLCLGAQLIARSFGADVKKLPRDVAHTSLPGPIDREGMEFGFMPQEFSEAARLDKVVGKALKEAEAVGKATQAAVGPKFCEWHSDCFDYPMDSVPLSTRPTCATQAFRLGRRTYAFQYHIEVGEEMGKEWYQEYLEGTVSHCSSGPGAAGDDKAKEAAMKQLASCIEEGSVAQCEAFTKSVMRSLLDEAQAVRKERLLWRQAIAAAAVASVATLAVVTFASRLRARRQP